MKKLLLILILTLSFQSWTKADDISDFEIEGMSIGDSLLELFTKKELITLILPFTLVVKYFMMYLLLVINLVHMTK